MARSDARFDARLLARYQSALNLVQARQRDGPAGQEQVAAQVDAGESWLRHEGMADIGTKSGDI